MLFRQVVRKRILVCNGFSYFGSCSGVWRLILYRKLFSMYDRRSPLPLWFPCWC